MKKHSRKTIASLIAGMMVVGCASFEPAMRSVDLTNARRPSIQNTLDGLEISVEEFAAPEKSRQAFDADLLSSGVLALLVRAESKGTSNYKIFRDGITAQVNGQPLSQLQGTDAANQGAASEYVGKAPNWTVATGPFAVLLWPVTVAGSAAHTRSVKRRIQQHFESLQFSDALLKPNQSAAGFVYFKLPAHAPKPASLTIALQASEEASGKHLPFVFSLSDMVRQ